MLQIRTVLWIVVGGLLWLALYFGLRSAHGQSQDPACQLPAVAFLGEGPGVYTSPPGYSQMIIKKFTPFRFEVLSAAIYTSTRHAAPPERVWACEGNCTLPAVYHDTIDLGYQSAGARFDVVIIDDDTDDRLNWWAVDDPAVPVDYLSAQGLVQSATYTTPIAGNWYLYAADSIGLVQPCVNPPVPTPVDQPQPPTDTPAASPTFPQTPTVAATATQTTVAGYTPTSTPSATPSPSSTPTEQPGATATATATNTPRAALTLTATPTAPTVPTVTASPTATPVAIAPPAATATTLPTNLGDGPEPAPMPEQVYFPIVAR